MQLYFTSMSGGYLFVFWLGVLGFLGLFELLGIVGDLLAWLLGSAV